MTTLEDRPATWQTVEWQPVVKGRTKDIPIKCLVSGGALEPAQRPIFVLPGFGEEMRAAPHAVAALEDEGLESVVVVLPTSFTRDRISLERGIKEAPLSVIQHFNERRGMPADTKAEIVGKSQGGGIVIMAGHEAPELFESFGLVSPVGLTNEHMGNKSLAQLGRFVWRLAVLNSLESEQNPFKDRGNLSAFYEVPMRAIKDAAKFRLMAKLAIGFSLDLSKHFLSLSQTHNTRLFIGDHDQLFRHGEYLDTLSRIGCDNFEVFDGSHSPLTNSAGRSQVARAGRWIREVRAGLDA